MTNAMRADRPTETPRRSFRVLIALLGGAVPGWMVGVLPHLPLGGASELLSSRAYLLELMFLVLAKVFPVSVMKWLREPLVIPFLFVAAGAVVGLSSFLLLRREASPRRRFLAAVSMSAAALLFLLLVPILKALLFYPAREMLSLQGGLLLAGALLLSALTGVLIYLLFKALRVAGYAFLAPVVVLSAVLVSGPFRSEPPASAGFIPRRVVLIGVDAASWNVLRTLAGQGRLPHLEGFIRTGAHGSLRTTLPIRSPAIWTTIATGRSAVRHGVQDYVLRDPETGELLPTSVSLRRVPALWDLAGRAGLETHVVAWPASWPAEKVPGVFLSDRLGVRGLDRRSEPPAATGEFEALVSPAEDGSFPPGALAEVATKLLARTTAGLFLIFFDALDSVQHRFWAPFDVGRGSPLASLLFGRLPAPTFDAGSAAVAEAYVEVDRAVGAIIAAAGEDAVCILVSGHGQGPARGPMTFALAELLERLGWLAFRPGTRDVDWTLTKLFDGTRDLKGRDLPRALVPNVRPESPLRTTGGPAASGEFLAQAARTLAGLRTVRGRALFTKVRLVPPRGSGPPRLDVWIDTDLEADDELLIDGTRLPVTAVVDKTRLTGMHRVEGVFLARGPGMRRGFRLKDAGILDVAPTVLYLLDLPVGGDIEGRVLTEAIDGRLLAARPVKRLATGPSAAGPVSGAAATTEAKNRLLEDLRSLGYIRATPGRRHGPDRPESPR